MAKNEMTVKIDLQNVDKVKVILESQALYIKRLEVLVVDMAETAYDEARLGGCDTWADFKRYKVDKALKEASHDK